MIDHVPGNVTAAHRLVEALVANGVSHVFCVPGESYLAVLDALADAADRIEVITCRHEAGAANMAEAYGKLTGRPGVCMVTRGPGATQAAVGVHTAQQDSTALLLFVGQVATADKGRGAFQEVDYRRVFGDLAKHADELDDPRRTAEVVGRAFATAQQGRRGPVVLALPEDVLREQGGPAVPGAIRPAHAGLAPDLCDAIAARLAEAQRPLLVLGGSGWSDAALVAIRGWAERHALPVALSFRRKDLLDNDHPCYAGDLGIGTSPALAARAREADLVVAIGARLGESATGGYTLFTAADTAERLIHIHPGAEEIGRTWPVSIGAIADVSPAALALSRTDLGRQWTDWRDGAHADYRAFATPIPAADAVNLSEVVAHLADALPADAVLCNGAGNFAAWLHRFYCHRRPHTQLAPTSGAMGYGFPAAIAAKILHPDREVLCFAGDGDFTMSCQEFATAVRYRANVVTVVVDNRSFGTIRMHQEREFPGRVIATDLDNPDFAALARSFGGWGTLVESTADFPRALAEARGAGVPALIHLRTGTEQIAPGATISALRAGTR